MQSEWMKTRQTKYTLYVTVYLLVIVAVSTAFSMLWFLAKAGDESPVLNAGVTVMLPFAETVPMPANNLSIIFRREGQSTA